MILKLIGKLKIKENRKYMFYRTWQDKEHNEKQSQQFLNPIDKANKEAKLISLTNIHDSSLSCVDTGTSIKGGVVKLIALGKTSTLSEMKDLSLYNHWNFKNFILNCKGSFFFDLLLIIRWIKGVSFKVQFYARFLFNF